MSQAPVTTQVADKAVDAALSKGPDAASTAAGDTALVKVGKAALDALKDGKFDTADVLNVAGVGLEALGTKFDATGAASSSPLGELLQLVVSNIKFLAEPLEKLMGSPEAVTRQAGAWDSIATSYTQAGEQHAAGKGDLSSWTGAAADNYTQVREVTTKIFPSAALGATAMGNAVRAMGELVAIVRKTIWDIIAQFLGTVIKSALTALATVVPTFGASIGAFAAWFVGDTVRIAKRLFTMLAKLIAKGKEVLTALKADSKKLDEAATAMRAMVQQLSAGGKPVAAAGA